MTEITENRPSRPELLKVLCILSFIGGGLSVLSNSFMFIFIDLWLQAYSEGDFETLISGFNMESIEMFMNVDKTYFLFQAILYAASLTGVYFMWNLKKTGFHLYTVAQVLVLILQQIYFPSLPFPFLPFIITLTFVLLYFTNLKHME